LYKVSNLIRLETLYNQKQLPINDLIEQLFEKVNFVDANTYKYLS